MKLPLSVLDLSPVGVGVAPSQAIRDSVELAIHADRLGYTRYWFAEHHNMASIATSSPEVLIAHVAAKTERIRVGAGGIMIPNHTPLRVVEIFRTLEALHPGRIDLGLGRAPGTDPVTASALRRSDDPEVNNLLAELLAFEHGRFPERHPFAKIVPMPSDVRCTAIWMLGSTLAGASIAAQLGLPYAFAGHFAMQHARDAIAHYRKSFEPSAQIAAPYAMCAVTTICGADDDEARRLAAPIRVAIVNTRTGKRAPIVSVEDALAHRFTPDEQAIADEFLEGAVIGGPAYVGDALPALAARIGADELMLSTLIPSLDDRRASLERIARVLG
ncbi:MAG: LLM class flavin-dependent oxidoreductase [Myxococcota bacterium]|nr:LLM class flavin-dependent oxidoreductase [Myxococcota bacterium]